MSDLSRHDKEAIERDGALIFRYLHGEITEVELYERATFWGRDQHPPLELAIAMAGAVTGAIAEVSHRPFTVDEVLAGAKDAIDAVVDGH